MIRSRAADAPRWNGVPLEAVLLDLDGTLVDSAADVASVLNLTLAEFDFASIDPADVRQMIGGGAQVLMERALRHLRREAGPVLLQSLIVRFLSHYDTLVRYDASKTCRYEGVSEGLSGLQSMGLKLAVVTNKHQRIATQLLQRMHLAGWIDVVIGRDNCERGKPDPQPLLLACQALYVEPGRTLMVGDSQNDVSAARAAGIPVVCVPYGYNEGGEPRALPCDAYVETLADLPGLLRRGGGRPARVASVFPHSTQPKA